MPTLLEVRKCRTRSARGFTLVELMVAMAVVGLLLAVSIPVSVRFYQSMQYKEAVRDVITLLSSARFTAVNSGSAQDVSLNPQTNELRFNDESQVLPAQFSLAIHSAREVNRSEEGIIRFYPEGGSSGGDIDLVRPDGSGVKISVDWLAGRVSHASYVFE